MSGTQGELGAMRRLSTQPVARIRGAEECVGARGSSIVGDALLELCQVAALHRLGELANGHFLLLTRCCVRARGALLVPLDAQRALLVAGGARCLRG
eukprot:scaffold69369_cov84-Phaeocystis_antarctica.AAC.1